MTADPYLDHAAGVLINRLGIANPEHLQQVREIFGDVYPLLGQRCSDLVIVALAKRTLAQTGGS